jgi:excisionase family DNA binding protein
MMTVKQAAGKLGVSPALVYALVAARRIRHERHGLGRGRIRIAEDALDEYRRRQTVEVAEAVVAPPPRPRRIYKHVRV